MTIEWRVTQKPDFFKALLALPPKETHQVLEKINLLFPGNQCDLDIIGERQVRYTSTSIVPGKCVMTILNPRGYTLRSSRS
jgi:hypothetical protein